MSLESPPAKITKNIGRKKLINNQIVIVNIAYVNKTLNSKHWLTEMTLK